MKNQRFNFVGAIDCNTDEGAKVPFIREITGNATGLSLNLTVVAAQNNRAFLECPGFKNDTIKSYDSDGNELNIDWDDRFDEKIVDKVASYKKNVITLNGDRHEFVSAYDFNDFIRKNINEIKGKRYTVTGQVKKNVYNGKITDRFVIQSMYEVKEDDERKNQLRVTCDFFFNKDSFDLADWKNEKKVIINGYTCEYIDKANPSVYVNKQLIFDCSKIDFGNEKHVNILKYRLKQIGCDYADEKIKVSLKKGYYHIITICSYQNGNEEVEFDESQLNDNQKMAIELGLKTLDDFRPSGNIFGERVTIYKLVDYDLRGDFENGCVATDEDVDGNLYAVCQNESLDDFEKAINPPTEKNEFEDADEDFDLFG